MWESSTHLLKVLKATSQLQIMQGASVAGKRETPSDWELTGTSKRDCVGAASKPRSQVRKGVRREDPATVLHIVMG